MNTRRPPQWFYFGPWAFSIDEADALITAAPREPSTVEVATWARTYGLTLLDEPHPTAINLLGPTRETFNRAYAMTTDLTKR